MRVEKNLPEGLSLAWGFEATAVGFFVEVRRREAKPRFYDGLQPFCDRDRPLLGVLNFLVETAVISDDDRDAVLLGDAEPGDHLTATAALAADILDDLRHFAGD